MWKELYTLDDSVECLSDQLSAFADAEPFRDFQQYPVLYIDFKVNWLVSVSKGVILIGSRKFKDPPSKPC